MALLAVVAPVCLGDQLQWNAWGVCEDARQVIGRAALVVSYCSLADKDTVQLWLVRDSKIVTTPVEGLYEVVVSARCLYRSDRAVSAEEFPISVGRWAFDRTDSTGWFAEGVDLAYVYIHTGGTAFQCLGKLLGLDCVVAVESMNLPADVMETLTGRGYTGRLPSLWTHDIAPRQGSLPRR